MQLFEVALILYPIKKITHIFPNQHTQQSTLAVSLASIWYSSLAVAAAVNIYFQVINFKVSCFRNVGFSVLSG